MDVRPGVEIAPPRFTTIGGVTVMIVEPTRSPLPPTLDSLLRGLAAVRRHPTVARLGGYSAECSDSDHRFEPWLSGLYVDLDLLLLRCVHCGVVEVRDVSYDILGGARRSSLAARRRNVAIGWYSGKRAAGRVYL